MTETLLRVPIAAAAGWNLEETLVRSTEEIGIFYDGGEESGAWEIHRFDNIGIPDLITFLTGQLPDDATMVVTGLHEVTVQLPATWLQILGSPDSAYQRMIKKLAAQLGEDPVWQNWWNQNEYNELWIQESHDPEGHAVFEKRDSEILFLAIGYDLSELHGRHHRNRLQTIARDNLARALDATAEFLDKPHPSLV